MQHSTRTREPPNMDNLASTLDEGASSHRSQDCWGYMLETKREKTVCIVFQNIARLPKDPEASYMKLELTCQWITQIKLIFLDVLSLVNVGTLLSIPSTYHKKLGMVGGHSMEPWIQLIRATPWGGSTRADWHSSF